MSDQAPVTGAGAPAPRRARRHRVARSASVVLLAVAFLAAGAIGIRRGAHPPAGMSSGAAEIPVAATFRGRVDGSLASPIERLQAHLASTPDDHASWALLGLAYIQEARISVNPSYYPLAEGALDESFAANRDDNFLGFAGRSALAAARHDFATARELAAEGLEINPYSALLWGVLSDAETQLGDYAAAAEHAQRMVDLSPDTASLARVSYTWELRGDLDQATALMRRALEAAPSAADRAFALYFLGELAFAQGDATGALRHYHEALDAAPQDSAALAGRAKALAATGQTQTALDAYAALVERVPDPAYLVPYGELLESLGRDDAAAEQYRLVELTRELYAANGVGPDAADVLFLADHGDPAEARRVAELAIEQQPFVAVHDAYAWALYRNGDYEAALQHSDLALHLGTANASFLYHRGMIRHALGDRAGAVADLAAALALNPHFDPLGSRAARETLDALGAP